MGLLTILLIILVVCLIVPWALPMLLAGLLLLPVFLMIAIALPFLALGTLFGSKRCEIRMKKIFESSDNDDDDDDWDDEDCDISIRGSSISINNGQNVTMANGKIIINGEVAKCEKCPSNANYINNDRYRCRKHN